MRTGLSKKVGDTLWLHFGGRTYTVKLKSETQAQRGNKNRGGSSSGNLKSPMPGKILKVNLAEGAPVSAGQTVAVIEAMKMEYALKSPFEGTVKAVHKKAGEPVQLDELVAELEPAQKSKAEGATE